jgi:hypothetical protein
MGIPPVVGIPELSRKDLVSDRDGERRGYLQQVQEWYSVRQQSRVGATIRERRPFTKLGDITQFLKLL